MASSGVEILPSASRADFSASVVLFFSRCFESLAKHAAVGTRETLPSSFHRTGAQGPRADSTSTSSHRTSDRQTVFAL